MQRNIAPALFIALNRLYGNAEKPGQRPDALSPAVRRLVTRCVHGWYQGMTGVGERRVRQHTPTTLAQTFRQLAGSQPVYYLWARDARGWALIDRGQRDMVET